jgi:hypothetical protein
MYDPRLGRFGQLDRNYSNRHLVHYSFALNNPLLFVDPIGSQEQVIAVPPPDPARGYGDDPNPIKHAFVEREGRIYKLKSTEIETQVAGKGGRVSYRLNTRINNLTDITDLQGTKYERYRNMYYEYSTTNIVSDYFAANPREWVKFQALVETFGWKDAFDRAKAAKEEGKTAGDLLRDEFNDPWFWAALMTRGKTQKTKKVLDEAEKRGSAEVRKATAAARKIIEQHHQLPQALEKNFKRAGLDIEKFKIPLSREKHRLRRGGKPFGLHTGPDNWNKAWEDYFNANPEAKRDQILKQLDKMRKDFGLE